MCIFCEKKFDIVYEDEVVYVIYDGFPVSKGHVLVITKAHRQDYFEATLNEKKSIDKALLHMKVTLDRLFQPDGYNIGINNGVSAGQTVRHLHVHLIPRYTGDMENPRGGVRGVIPSKQAY